MPDLEKWHCKNQKCDTTLAPCVC